MDDNRTEDRQLQLQAIPDLSLLSSLAQEDPPIDRYSRLPLSSLKSLGVAFEPLSNALRTVFSGSGSTTQYCRITVPAGAQLVGSGSLGTLLDENSPVTGQAVIKPLVLNPAAVFMAATLSNIDSKLSGIQDTQQEMLDFLEQKEESALRGDLMFLAELLGSFRFNWNNETFKGASHVKVLDIRQAAGRKIDFYQRRIETKLRKKRRLHSDQDVKKDLEDLRGEFKDYQLALYQYAFSSFLEVMLLGNYDRAFLSGVIGKIEACSYEYRDLYTRSYDQIENSAETSVQSSLIRSFASTFKTAGEAIGKIPLVNRTLLDESLIASGSRLADLQQKRTEQTMQFMIDKQSSCVHPFLESIQAVDRLYNEPFDIYLDQDSVYLPKE